MIAAVVGTFGSESIDALRKSASRAGAALVVYRTVEEARTGLSLGDPHLQTPRCVFLETTAPSAAAFVAWIHGDVRLFSLPLIFMVSPLDPLAYSRADALGADDIVGLTDWDGVTRRLMNLADFDPDVRPPITEGVAIVAHQDMGRRQILGRALRQAGFDPTFAADAHELTETSAHGTVPRIVVVAGNLPPVGAFAALAQLRSRTDAPRLPAIVLAAPEDRRDVQDGARQIAAVAVTSELDPPHDLVFLANELLRPDYRELRTAPRLLFGTLCGFRPAGHLGAVYGITYNLSREGLYIRTLDPPKAGAELWVELQPPGSGGIVHLRGHAVWARPYGVGGAAPPGFGVRLSPDACPARDVQAYWEGVDRMSAEPRLRI